MCGSAGYGRLEGKCRCTRGPMAKLVRVDELVLAFVVAVDCWAVDQLRRSASLCSMLAVQEVPPRQHACLRKPSTLM